MSGNPFTGMQYVWRGFQNLKTPGLRRYVAFPLLLNIIVMGFASVWGISQLDAWIGQLVDLLPGWLSFLYWILMPLVVIFLVLSLVYFFSAVLMIIAGPLNGLLAERVETLQGHSIPDE
ncbi:MAG: EI24 domain-containing protein, partial [Pseudomonadota bacterium]|nr:EI24 domain-containing protein [Pseudomonadota bacterium]